MGEDDARRLWSDAKARAMLAAADLESRTMKIQGSAGRVGKPIQDQWTLPLLRTRQLLKHLEPVPTRNNRGSMLSKGADEADSIAETLDPPTKGYGGMQVGEPIDVPVAQSHLREAARLLRQAIQAFDLP